MDIELAYNQVLDYLYSFVDYSLKHASELAKADFNLDRMFALMESLGNPQNQYPIIHVAGTKGKGSVSAFCASALKAAGYKVGLYTSPHLIDYVERIQVNGEPISHAQLVELVEEIKPYVARIEKLTTFEITTALAFMAFAKYDVNAAVFEVGLGGRLDATNIVTPKVSVITSLSYDHMAVLGDTLTLIAGEKAGIIKPGAPVVSSPQVDEALEVLLRAAKLRGIGAGGSTGNKGNEVVDDGFILVGRDVKFELIESSLDGQLFRITDYATRTDYEFRIPLLGLHQIENAATAYAALKASGIPITDEQIQKGFSEVKWPARFEVVRREPPVIIDSAHNRESALYLRKSLDAYFPGRPVIMIFCSLEDKDISGMLEELSPRLEKVIATRADHPRAPTAEWIAEKVEAAGIPVEIVTPAASALNRALELAGDQKIVLTAGSVAFAGEIIAAWRKIAG